MNINKLIQSINQAKKIRKSLPYHRDGISGVDVEHKLLPQVLKTIKALFKVFKLSNFDIRISHWGEIMVVEPNKKIKVIISVGYFEQVKNIELIKESLKGYEYFSYDMLKENPNELLIRMQACRPNTRFWDYRFSEVESGLTPMEDISNKIIEITSTLTKKSSFDPFSKFGQPTIEDVLALSRYGSALYGKKTHLYYLVRDKELLSYPQRLIISKSEIKVESFNETTKSYLLNTKAFKLLSQLPLNFETEEIIIER